MDYLEEVRKEIKEEDQIIDRIFLAYCNKCERKNRMTMKPCPTCGIYETAQPVSETVADNCDENYMCDRCEAYREHLAY